MALLLGRGDTSEDVRLGQDHDSREALLELLAMHMVVENVGSVSESDCVAILDSSLKSMGWPDSPTNILENLTQRRVLKKNNGQVLFARASYLHYFAAKRAVKDTELLDYLLEKPLYFSSIITDYASLKRYDAELLRTINRHLDRTDWEELNNPIFEALPKLQGESPEALLISPPTKSNRHYSKDRELLQARSFDLSNDEDDSNEPFPILEEKSVPRGITLMRLMSLVSNVLRDSYEITDRSLKTEVFENVLTHWGIMTGTVHADPSFRDFITYLTRQLLAESDKKVTQERHEEVVDMFLKVFPAAFALSGVTHELSTAKLSLAFDELLQNKVLISDTNFSIGAAFFAYSIRPADWVSKLRLLLINHCDSWVVRHFFLNILVKDENLETLEESEWQELSQLCIDLIQKSTSYESNASRRTHYDDLLNTLRKRRIVAKVRNHHSDLPKRHAE
ncbi:hypothetical protein V5R04_06925 [Jonesiaceae bacterium BS-20]|uniref:Uncharacterized protein n=1 Tax=Jonesiaceae bacterium BS-20 TaxID=3120821 RepID=A0AAU7DY49_9MICO